MIINISRANFFQTCRRKQWFYDKGLTQLTVIEPLTMGGAYHVGAAKLATGGRRTDALQAAEDFYRAELAKATMTLPEERPIHERNIELVKRMLNAQATQYERDTWTVLMPEVEFCIPLPNTEHHCVYFHNILHPRTFDPANETDMSNWLDSLLTCKDPRCWQPHRLRGRTDGVLNWNHLIWILERKTSGMKQQIFWDQWYLSHQLSAYVYGVRKATGLPVNGVILEKSPKPARNQDPFSFDYSPEREPYLRSEDDLSEFEDEISRIACDYESAAASADPFHAFYRNPQSCINWNRRCDFWATCKRHGNVEPGEYRTRQLDYVEEEYYKILGLPIPQREGVNVTTDQLAQTE